MAHSRLVCAVLAVDARDLTFQREPLHALAQARGALGLRDCQLTFAADCACAAVDDTYFQKWAGCLPAEALAAIGRQPPVNGDIVHGRAAALRTLYFKAALLAATAGEPRCAAGGREQHLLTAAALSLRARRPAEVCVLPNDLRRHAAFFNMGVFNNISDVRLDEASGRVRGVGDGDRAIVALVHQFDRWPAVAAFVRRHQRGTNLGNSRGGAR